MTPTNLGRWLIAWGLFWVGHTVSRLDRWDVGWLIALWFPIYQHCMAWSADIQGEGDCGPWQPPSGEP